MLVMCMAGCGTMNNSENKSVLLLDTQCSCWTGGVGHMGAAAVSMAVSSAAEEANKAFLSPSHLLIMRHPCCHYATLTVWSIAHVLLFEGTYSSHEF